MRVLTAAALAALLAWACAPAAPGGDLMEPPTTVGGEAPRDQAGCQGAGGDWRREGMLGAYMCVTPYADAGRSCTDGAQCQGDCRLADDGPAPMGGPATGVCQANSSPFGCFTRVDNGRASATLCVD